KRSPLLRRLRQQFQLNYRSCTMPVRSPYPVTSRISATDHPHLFPSGMNRVVRKLTRNPLALTTKKFHSKINPFGFPSRDSQIPWLLRASGQNNRVKLVEDFFCFYTRSDFRPRGEYDSFLLHHFHPSVYYPFFQLEIRNAIP